MSREHKRCGGKIVLLSATKSHVKKYECNRCNKTWTKYRKEK